MYNSHDHHMASFENFQYFQRAQLHNSELVDPKWFKLH